MMGRTRYKQLTDYNWKVLCWQVRMFFFEAEGVGGGMGVVGNFKGKPHQRAIAGAQSLKSSLGPTAGPARVPSNALLT